MQKLSNDKLKNITGGGINWSIAAGISALASFLIGVIDGLINPKKCNN